MPIQTRLLVLKNVCWHTGKTENQKQIVYIAINYLHFQNHVKEFFVLMNVLKKMVALKEQVLLPRRKLKCTVEEKMQTTIQLLMQ